MTKYTSKVVQNLKPQWYLEMSTKEKLKFQEEMMQGHKEALSNKPESIMTGTALTAKESNNSLSKGRKYIVRGHFCSLVTTIYQSKWNQFVTVKNDFGYTVKMNLNNFD